MSDMHLRAQLFVGSEQASVATILCESETISVCGPDGNRRSWPAVASSLDALLGFLGRCTVDRCEVNAASGRRMETPCEVILTLLLSELAVEVRGNDGEMADMAFAHAFPLRLARRLRGIFVAKLELMAEARQFALLARNDLFAVETQSQAGGWIKERHRRLLNRNRDLKASAAAPGDVLQYWPNFCAWRFGETPSALQMKALSSVFESEAFFGKEYSDEEGWVASALIFSNEATVFDVIGPWRASAASRRLGVYTGVLNLMEAQARGRNYCLCYGRFPYKAAIASGFGEITL